MVNPGCRQFVSEQNRVLAWRPLRYFESHLTIPSGKLEPCSSLNKIWCYTISKAFDDIRVASTVRFGGLFWLNSSVIETNSSEDRAVVVEWKGLKPLCWGYFGRLTVSLELIKASQN